MALIQIMKASKHMQTSVVLCRRCVAGFRFLHSLIMTFLREVFIVGRHLFGKVL